MISRSFTEISRRNLLHMFSLLGLTAFARGTGAATDPARINAVPDDAGRTRRFLTDTDTASDDAVALVMALRNPGVSVEAITVVAGNMPIEKGLQNALYTRDLCGITRPFIADAVRRCFVRCIPPNMCMAMTALETSAFRSQEGLLRPATPFRPSLT